MSKNPVIAEITTYGDKGGFYWGLTCDRDGWDVDPLRPEQTPEDAHRAGVAAAKRLGIEIVEDALDPKGKE